MKKIIYILAIAVAIISYSCSRDTFFYGDESSAEGCVSFNIGLDAATRADYLQYPYTVCKILIRDTANGNDIVRRYTDIKELPSDLWLVAGSYRIEVYLGENKSQSWDKPYYYGYNDFAITANQTTPPVSVLCTLKSTVVKVLYAHSIVEHFNAGGYQTDVMIGDTFDEAGANKLTYTESKDGYFNFPDGQNKISFRFNGQLKDGGSKVFTREGFELDADKLHGYRHTLEFSYTVVEPDKGYITLNVKVEEETTTDDVMGIDPDAVIAEGAKEMSKKETAAAVWNGESKLTAYSTAEDKSNIKIEYRKGEAVRADDWTVLDTYEDDEDNYYYAMLPLEPDTRYEYRLTVNGEQDGDICTLTTPAYVQIPGGGFEEWSTQGKAPSPYIDANNQWWDTGNSAAADYGVVLTTGRSGGRPGTQGAMCAELVSKYAVIKLAAGNIFIGKFLALDGTDGVVAFGKPLDFTFRPKAVTFWCKCKVGNINRVKNTPPNGAKEGDPDCVNVYVCLTNMGGPHIVNTKKPETYMSFDEPLKTISYCTNVNGKNSTNDKDNGRVIAYKSWDYYDTDEDWHKVTLELDYNEEYDDVAPNYLMFTASANKYGDYYTGCDSNELLIDDVEFVY